MQKLSVTSSSGNRLDKFLAEEIKILSRSRIKLLISQGRATVNYVVVTDPNHRIKYKDEVLLDDFDTAKNQDITPDPSVSFTILYEDEGLLVVNKPAGVVVHPGAGNHSSTLVNGLLSHCGGNLSSDNDKFRPGIVHRIDKDTSGILVVAKNDFYHCELSKQFACHSIVRKYVCFCYSVLRPLHGKIETLIARDKNNRLKMTVSKEDGRRALTHYKTLVEFSQFASKVECELKTGRTHQIRVHLSHKGCSLIGDLLYRAKNYSVPPNITTYLRNFCRQALHAYFLEFTHPHSGKMMHFTCDLPQDMLELEAVLRNPQLE
ncbi:MAG: RluA family pseudouridine synthase [Holosporaceae bacterium]|jgi:23S rRNA pseudouridine1911/1915/1917 synthase|nr:RluA family pseudouridine synthase [Holosporaceae bacterium]